AQKVKTDGRNMKASRIGRGKGIGERNGKQDKMQKKSRKVEVSENAADISSNEESRIGINNERGKQQYRRETANDENEEKEERR
ncbi:7659_t:CDS:1, partial [Rhizophagus irregularis]